MFADYDAHGVTEVLGLDGSLKAMPGFGDAGKPFEHAPDVIGPGARSVPPGSEAIEAAVEQGLPRRVLRHLAERIAGSDKGKVSALEWSIVPKTTLERRDSRLSPQESERTERVARLFVQARRALGTEDEARSFMLTPHPELDGRSPIEAARTDLATRRVERVLGAIEYGLVL